MNRKQFILLIVLVIVIGGAGLVIHHRNGQSWQNADSQIGGKLLPKFNVNDVAQIQIQSGTNALQLVRRDDLWRVAQRADYPADFSKISGLLLKLAGLKIVQNEPVGPSQLGRFDLLPPGTATNTATLLEFKNAAGQTLATLLLGKPHLQKPSGNSSYGGMDNAGWPDGRYVLTATNAASVDVVSDPLDEVQPTPAQWLDKTFLSIQKPSAISVQFPQTTNDWTLTRASETNAWQLAAAKPGEKLDSSKLYSVTQPFSSASFSDVAPPGQSAATNETILTVKTFDGFTYVASIGAEQGGDYPVTFKISADLPTERVAATDEKPDEKAKLDQAFAAEHAKLTEQLAQESKLTHWTYLLPSYTVDELLKKRDELLLPPPKPAASATVKK